MLKNMKNDRANMKNDGAKGGKKKKGKKGVKIALFAVEILILAGLLFLLYMMRDFGNSSLLRLDTSDSSDNGDSDDGDGSGGSGGGAPQINETVKENEQMKVYRNIALFGVDSTSGALTKGTRSDVTIIASVNMETGDIKLVSVYRDTLLNIGSDKYRKCNQAYFSGGAQQAMDMLNLNLDLDITDFVTVGFGGLKEAIDALGGIYIDVDSAELVHINSYQITMSEDLKCSYTPVEKTGYQLLDGLQAVAYCRIRYTKGGDFKRAERQREVIQAIIDRAKEASVSDLINVVNKVTEAGEVYTSLDIAEILELVPNILKYQIVDEGGFPLEKYRGTGTLGSIGDCVLPLDLEKNVVWLHEFLFGEEDYELSDKAAEYSQGIRDKIAEYKPDMKYPE